MKAKFSAALANIVVRIMLFRHLRR